MAETREILPYDGFTVQAFPEGVPVNSLAEVKNSLPIAFFRWIAYQQDKYQSPDKIPVFGGLVISVVPLCTDKVIEPFHRTMADHMGFNSRDCIGGFVRCTHEGALRPMAKEGFSEGLNDVAQGFDNQKRLLKTLMQISNETGVVLMDENGPLADYCTPSSQQV